MYFGERYMYDHNKKYYIINNSGGYRYKNTEPIEDIEEAKEKQFDYIQSISSIPVFLASSYDDEIEIGFRGIYNINSVEIDKREEFLIFLDRLSSKHADGFYLYNISDAVDQKNCRIIYRINLIKRNKSE